MGGQWSRRRWLAWLGSLALLGIPGRWAGMSTPSVIVIGAGAAGLGAARRLHDAGLKVTTLEARDRLGGRMHSSYDFARYPIELGAEYIHGDRVATWSLLRQAGMRARPAFEDAVNTILHLGDERLTVEQWGLMPNVDLLGEERYYQMAQQWVESGEDDISLADLLDENDILLGDSLYSLIDGAMQGFLAAPLDQFSTYSLLEFEDDPGGNYRVAQGYSRLFEGFAEGLSIRYGAEVRRIEWGGNRVRVTLADGSALEADRVIITLPLGVLQAEVVTFDPALPAAKQRAIAGLGSGAVNKLILHFEDAFWPETMEMLYTERLTQNYWRPGWGRRDEQPILTGFIGGRGGEALSEMGEKEAIATALDDLKAIFGTRSLSRLRSGQFVDWWGDPFSRMGYSYVPVGSAGLRQILAEPVGDQLFFAGEASNVGRPALVHGALETGYRAARQVQRSLD